MITTQPASSIVPTNVNRSDKEAVEGFVVAADRQAKPLGFFKSLERDAFELGRHVLGKDLGWSGANKFLFDVEKKLGLNGSAFEASGPVNPPGTPPKLTQHGGAVLTRPVIHNLYVGDYFNSKLGQADVQENEAYAQDFGQSALMGIAQQYGAGAAQHGNSTVLAGPNPTTVTEADVQRYVQQALSSGAVSRDAQGMYTVVLPPNTVLDAGGGTTSKVGLGGFHGSFDDGSGQPIYYAVIAYSDSRGNGINFDNNSQDAINITESHEWMEAMTDPDVNSPLPGRNLGWYDESDNGEIGDLAISQLPLDQTFERDAGGYMQQLEWSNQDGKYEIASGNNQPPPPPPPPSTGPGGIC